MSASCFSDDFLFGAATSAYQIEGSPLADGAGPSNWHAFSHTPGMVDNDDTGDIACDHYRRWHDDIRLMRELGLQAYRYSIAWNRVFPAGDGKLNPRGLDFYKRVTETLRAADIQPFITLHHWDLPLALAQQGGWEHPDTARRFADYAHTLFLALDGYAPTWTTINEPWVIVDAGYIHGVHPPGLQNPAAAARAAHQLLLAHAYAVEAYRAVGRNHIGMVVNLAPYFAASDDPEDALACLRGHTYMNQWFLDPLLLGAYPDALAAQFGPAWPQFDPAELRHIAQPIDFLGINYYTRVLAADDPQASLPHIRQARVAGAVYTEMDWEIYPEGLARTLLWVRRRYPGIPLYVTENGAAVADPPPQAGVIDDPMRSRYIRDHLRAVQEAIRKGADVRGYFVWSLLDNFEWACGYTKRFGLYAIDAQTGTRIAKRSAECYAEIIRTRGAVLADGE